jgi:hypothetical protein
MDSAIDFIAGTAGFFFIIQIKCVLKNKQLKLFSSNQEVSLMSMLDNL